MLQRENSLIYILSAILSLVCLAGCSTFNLERKKIEFADPIDSFKFKTVKPDISEAKGVLLRFKEPDKPLFYNDTYQIYSQISGDEAISIDINKTRKLSFSKAKQNDSFYILTETSTDNHSELGSEKILANSRGKILEFIEGEFKTDKGTVKFLSHSRSEIFPEKPVRIGDRWSYDETMEMEFDSMLISRKSEEPEKIKVNCRLEGFALIGTHRCAVISVNTVTNRKEIYSTLFSEMKVKVNIFINERMFFDYKRGLFLGVISNTESFSISENDNFSDHSRFQSISILEPHIKKKNE